jgi:CBS domain-containing protein
VFSVTGIGGEVFKGSLEHLLKVHHVHHSGRTTDAERRAKESVSSAGSSGADAETSRSAAAAYAKALEPQPERGPVYHAYQIMTPKVVTLPLKATVQEAWHTLDRHGIGQAPVTDPSTGLVGLVSRERLLHVLNEEDGRVRNVLPRSLSDVMTTPVVTAAPEAEVRRMVRVMLQYALPALPVLDESNALVGIVSRRDILKVIITDPPLTLWA